MGSGTPAAGSRSTGTAWSPTGAAAVVFRSVTSTRRQYRDAFGREPGGGAQQVGEREQMTIERRVLGRPGRPDLDRDAGDRPGDVAEAGGGRLRDRAAGGPVAGPAVGQRPGPPTPADGGQQ